MYSSPLPPKKNKKAGMGEMGGIPCSLLKSKFFLAVAHYRIYDENIVFFVSPIQLVEGWKVSTCSVHIRFFTCSINCYPKFL